MRAWQLTNRYAQLPSACFRSQASTPVASPSWLVFNEQLAEQLGLPEASPRLLEELAGNQPPPDAHVIATAYAGHQFGHFVPQLGDGRAVLLGEQTDRCGRRWEIQLKGAGRTAYSRGGDGRAALGPVLREYLLSESMHALGVPTTRALAAVLTGETVQRETALPGAILTRVASSHLRVGTFQYLAALGKQEALEQLTRFALQRHEPDALGQACPALALLSGVVRRQAQLVARWMSLGFIHGVMNTDNCSISGETIDYGPCAFMDDFDPAKRFSAIDRHGRYAWQNQPGIAVWNLARLAESLLPLIDTNEQQAIHCATAEIERFEEHYQAAWLACMRKRLALDDTPGLTASDHSLVNDLLTAMHDARLDYSHTFLLLSQDSLDLDGPTDLPSDLHPWRARWLERLGEDTATRDDQLASLRAHNPRFLPRNHLVEAALSDAEQGDLATFQRLLRVCTDPFSRHDGDNDLVAPPSAGQLVSATFCGT